MKEKAKKTMLDITKGYDLFIKDKAIAKKGKEVFDRIIKKASKPKPRSSK